MTPSVKIRARILSEQGMRPAPPPQPHRPSFPPAPVGASRLPDSTPRPAESLREILDDLPDGTLIVDPRGRLRFANRAAQQLFAWSREAMLEASVEDLRPPAYAATHRALRRGFLAHHPQPRAMGGGRTFVARRSDGTTFPVEIALSPVDWDATPCVLASIRDVGERAQLEQRDFEQREQLRAMIDHSPDLLLRIGAHRVVEYVNPALARLLDRAAAEVTGCTIADLPLPEPTLGQLEALVDAATSGQADGHAELAVPRADGVYWFDGRIACEYAPDGSTSHVMLTGRDVTAQRHERLATLLTLEIGRTVPTAPSIEQALRETLRLVCDATVWECGNAWRVDEDGRLRSVAEHHPERVPAEPFPRWCREARLAPSTGVAGEAWDRQAPIHVGLRTVRYRPTGYPTWCPRSTPAGGSSPPCPCRPR